MSPASPRCPSADLPTIARAFPLLGVYGAGEAYGTGHINDTFALTYDQAGQRVRYLLQRINDRIFRDIPALMDNIQRVSLHLAARPAAASDGRQALTLVPTRDGAAWHRAADGSAWRCYLFIERARTYDLIEQPQQAYTAARAFGEFQRALVDLPGPRLHETIPGFHDTRRRLAALQSAVAEDRVARVATTTAEIDFALSRGALAGRLLDLQARGELPERVTHNDTKLNNVMLDDATGQGVCVIDLDTVMPGLALYDFGDMVRSATNAAAEDERELSRVAMRPEIFEALVRGYTASAGAFLNPAEWAHLALSGLVITYEIGLRFLTDHLAGDVYFKVHRPGHNLDRARNQFALLRSLEQQEAAMAALVASLAPSPPPARP